MASLIASGGGSLLSVMGIFKAVGELAILAADIAQSVDEAAAELDLALEKTRKFIDKEAGTSRTREVLSDLSSILGKAMTSIKTADQNQQKFEAKLAALEKSLDNLVGSLNAGLDKLMKIKTEETKKKEFIKEVAKENKYLLEKIKAVDSELRPLRKFCEESRKEIADWKSKRLPKTKAAIRLASFVKVVGGLAAAGRTFAKIAGARRFREALGPLANKGIGCQNIVVKSRRVGPRSRFK